MLDVARGYPGEVAPDGDVVNAFAVEEEGEVLGLSEGPALRGHDYDQEGCLTWVQLQGPASPVSLEGWSELFNHGPGFPD